MAGKWGIEHAVFAAATAATVVGAVVGNERVQQIAKPLIAPALAARVLRKRSETETADTALLLAGLAAATVGGRVHDRPGQRCSSDQGRVLVRGDAGQLLGAPAAPRRSADPRCPAAPHQRLVDGVRTAPCQGPERVDAAHRIWIDVGNHLDVVGGPRSGTAVKRRARRGRPEQGSTLLARIGRSALHRIRRTDRGASSVHPRDCRPRCCRGS